MDSELDDERARRLIGKDVAVGITYVDRDGELIEQVQLHGHSIRAEKKCP